MAADNKELHHHFSTASTRKIGLGGRKILAIQKGLRREIEKKKGLHGGALEYNSGANYSNVKLKYKFQVKKDFHERRKIGDKSKYSTEKMKEPGFVGFDDDYRGPKPHPPKNNK